MWSSNEKQFSFQTSNVGLSGFEVMSLTSDLAFLSAFYNKTFYYISEYLYFMPFTCFIFFVFVQTYTYSYMHIHVELIMKENVIVHRQITPVFHIIDIYIYFILTEREIK